MFTVTINYSKKIKIKKENNPYHNHLSTVLSSTRTNLTASEKMSLTLSELVGTCVSGRYQVPCGLIVPDTTVTKKKKKGRSFPEKTQEAQLNFHKKKKLMTSTTAISSGDTSAQPKYRGRV